MSGRLLQIFAAAEAGARPVAADEARLEAGRGLVGDRYHREAGTFSAKLKGKPGREVTLIESESIDRFNRQTGLALAYGDLRRNLVTRGIRLNDFVGHEFRIGECRLEGVRLCEPCAHLAQTVAKQVLPALVHEAGLRARIVRGGTIRSGDAIADAGRAEAPAGGVELPGEV
jgi:MOSC domain-containing protein YiiM